VEMPVSRPTACAFGGHDLSDLYITSAAEPGQSLSGSLFVLTGAGAGLPTRPFSREGSMTDRLELG